MHRDDSVRSLKKFSAIAVVLVLGTAFHTLCWSSLFNRNAVIERSASSLSCPCAVDPGLSLKVKAVAADQRNCVSAAPAALVVTD